MDGMGVPTPIPLLIERGIIVPKYSEAFWNVCERIVKEYESEL